MKSTSLARAVREIIRMKKNEERNYDEDHEDIDEEIMCEIKQLQAKL